MEERQDDCYVYLGLSHEILGLLLTIFVTVGVYLYELTTVVAYMLLGPVTNAARQRAE